jgi:Undecaprenyl-phosphate galactose phosphotransferase WbaP
LVLDQNAPLPDLASVLGPADAVMVERIPIAEPEAAATALSAIARRYAGAYAVVSFDSSDAEKRQVWLDIIDHCFQRIILIPDMAMGGRVWHMAVSIGRLSGILMRQNLLDPRRMLLKRCLDYLLTLLAGIVAFPVMVALAAAIRYDSRGPVFFKQRRIGRNGKHFSVYKFRTRAVNAAELLEKHLADNPDARREWKETQKLKNDPRITRIGKLLRKTSLDELPQILNVLKGEMSLVGPRPVIDEEVKRYGKAYELYTRVRPGITGLWQVSGRNNLSYADRVWLDRHYVCNWSVWLDILIVARTIPEVFRCSGAY